MKRVWKVGDRVVVAWHKKEYGATITSANERQRFFMVETDEPYNREGDRQMSRYWFDLFEAYNDGRLVS